MKRGAIDSRITWVVAYMQRHLAEPLSVPALAEAVNLSPSRFGSLFRAQTGAAPAQFLQQLRLRRARLLVERTFLSVKEVMGLVGYTDPSHFSRDFRRAHGVSPSSIRGRGIVTSLPRAEGPSVKAPRHRRIRQRRARDPGRRCA